MAENPAQLMMSEKRAKRVEQGRRVDLRIILPSPWITRRDFDRLHWAAKGRVMQGFGQKVQQFCNLVGFSGCFADCRIDATRYDWRRLDNDNLVGGIKPLLDSLVVATGRNPHGVGLIADDNDSVLNRLHCDQMQLKRAEAADFRSEIWISGRLCAESG